MLKKRIFMMVCSFVVLMMVAVTFANANPANWPKKVRIGLIPTEGGADIIARFKPLINHLESVLGIEVEGKSASDYAGIITAMTHKHIEFAYFGPKSYTDAANKANAQAVALEMGESGQKGYYGVIISKKGSGIKTLEQAKGHGFAFNDPNSTSGYLVPMVLFKRDLKVDPKKYFKHVKWSGSHGASILGVKNGTIEVASTNDIDLRRMAEKGQVSNDDFNILWTSDLIPGSPMCVRGDLPESLKAAYAGALMMFNSDKMGLQKLQIGGYTHCDDSTYDPIRYLKKLKAELKGKK
ncbi:MAG: phosphonate ABC transporter substrate-binding protein [Thermodesulfobacteriota bacterium]|nr:phosphonate ABC transporter substrate-binding protein [Thermodesulfobacteriota bacterium]